MKAFKERMMHMLLMTSLGLSSTLMAGCKMTETSDSSSSKEPVVVNSEQEPLYSFDTEGDRLTIVVQSFGCTKAEHFELNTQLDENDKQIVTIMRNKPDLCRAMPRLMPVSMRLEYNSQRHPVSMTNPVGEHHFPMIRKK